MSSLQGNASSNPSATEREENAPVAHRSGEHGLDQTEDVWKIEIEGSGEEKEQDDVPAIHVQNSTNAASAKKVFGTMRRSNPTARKGNDQYNYEEKYPEDAIYEETTPNARVWRTYEDEGKIHDANMVEESRDNVDVLLVFAGLFSAVVTTFVVQTSQSLQPDYAAMSASLLYESVLIQRAIANGSPTDTIAPSSLNPTITFVPATTDVWVNGLWFTSLFLSLTTALVAVLVKQWLHHYVALPSGTPRDRSFTRQFRYAGFQKWHVQVIIGLLPVFMHVALAIFLGGLVVFLHPLWATLSWTICAATAIVYAAYVLAAILPIIFPQCPYRTPLCDLVYASFCRIVPRVSWSKTHLFPDAWKRRSISDMIHCLPLQTRNTTSLTMIESDSVQCASLSLAAQALDWLFSVSSNPTVQSIVIQSIGGLPLASEEMFFALRGDNRAMETLKESLLGRCLQKNGRYTYGPVPNMELKLDRLLRFNPRSPQRNSFRVFSNTDSVELATAILSNGYSFFIEEKRVLPGRIFTDIVRSSKLPPRCWFHLIMASEQDLKPLDPDNVDYTNAFPLHLCSAIVRSFNTSQGLKQDFNSPLILDFIDALPYFLDKIYDHVLHMFSEFVKDPSLPQSLRLFVAAIKFLLHRLSLPDSDTSHTTILWTLNSATFSFRRRTFTPQEATALITLLEDILVRCAILEPDSRDIVPRWNELYYNLRNNTILAYQSLTIISPSACSLRGPQSMLHHMTAHWDRPSPSSYRSDTACGVLTDLLARRIPVAFSAFLESQCLEFLGTHMFHEAFVPMISEYVAGISALQHESDGAATHLLHMDYLHNPHNLYTACSILAVHGFKDMNQASLYRDITTLVQLRPRDAAWDECRRKLRGLVESDGEDLSSAQLAWRNDGPRSAQVQAKKANITYAIQVLDDFFDGRKHTVVLSDSSPSQPSAGHIDRFLGWCLGRKPEGTPEQSLQV